MAIRAMWGFDHLPVGTTVGAAATGYGLAYGNFSLTVAGAGICHHEAGAIRMATSQNSAINATFTTTLAITDGVSPKAILGFRYILTPGLRQDNSFVIAGQTIAYTDLGITGYGEWYIEAVCDRVNKEINFFVSGSFRHRRATTVVPLIIGQAFSFNTPGWAGAGFNLRDFYFIDDTQDNTPCNRLGSVKVTALTIDSATAPNWISSDSKTPLEDINTPYTTLASMTAPTVTSPASLDPMTIGFAPLADQNSNIRAIGAIVDSSRYPTSSVTVDISAVLDGTTLAMGALNYADDVMKYALPSSIISRAPDGGKITPAKLKTMKVVFTPKEPA